MRASILDTAVTGLGGEGLGEEGDTTFGFEELQPILYEILD